MDKNKVALHEAGHIVAIVLNEGTYKALSLEWHRRQVSQSPSG